MDVEVDSLADDANRLGRASWGGGGSTRLAGRTAGLGWTSALAGRGGGRQVRVRADLDNPYGKLLMPGNTATLTLYPK